nr:MAG TPA: hypothetical protein [Caudoviricetes sp.]
MTHNYQWMPTVHMQNLPLLLGIFYVRHCILFYRKYLLRLHHR